MISTREIVTVDEVPGLLEIWRASAATGRELVSAADMDRLAQALEAVYLGNARVVVAEREGQVVGTLALEGARLCLLWVHHEHRRRGVGRALIGHAQALSFELQVEVGQPEHAVAAFLRAVGFAPAETTDGAPHGTVLRLAVSGSDPSGDSGRMES